MPNLELTEEVIEEIRATDSELLNDLVDELTFRPLSSYTPAELADKAWHWVREIATGRELILWIPHITDAGTVFTLNPGKVGDVPEVPAGSVEFVDRPPLDTSHQAHVEVIDDDA